jgi:hypothetical protein
LDSGGFCLFAQSKGLPNQLPEIIEFVRLSEEVRDGTFQGGLGRFLAVRTGNNHSQRPP